MQQRSRIQYPNVNTEQNQALDSISGPTNGINLDNTSQVKNNESPDYETVYSGTFCRLLPPPSASVSKQVNTPQSSPSTSLPSVPMTPTLQKLSQKFKLKSVLKKKKNNQADKNTNAKNGGDMSNTIVNNSGYDFHRAIEKLVEKMDLQLLDTSSESGYGSDQDSLTSNNSTSNTTSPSPLSSATSTTGASVPKTSPAIPIKPPSLPPRL